MLVLRQSTSIDIRMGPFVDATNGVDPEVGITLAAADQAEVLKENGAATVAMSGTFAAVTGCDGWYDYTVAAGDVDTVGEVVFVVQDSSVCLPVFVRAHVVEEAIYDALFDGNASGFDANGRVDVGSIGGTAQTANDNGADINAILSDTNELQTDWANGGRLDNILDARAAEASITALNDVSTADINAQVSDVLKTDTIAEMSQGAPTATPTAFQILNYLYRELIRNRIVVDTNTLNQKQIFADDGSTVLYEKDLTNASNITTVAEATTGA